MKYCAGLDNAGLAAAVAFGDRLRDVVEVGPIQYPSGSGWPATPIT